MFKMYEQFEGKSWENGLLLRVRVWIFMLDFCCIQNREKKPQIDYGSFHQCALRQNCYTQRPPDSSPDGLFCIADVILLYRPLFVHKICIIWMKKPESEWVGIFCSVLLEWFKWYPNIQFGLQCECYSFFVKCALSFLLWMVEWLNAELAFWIWEK